jgi:simple sugar transport system ATP-binding protein
MISDEIPEILRNCNRVLLMRDGRLEREIADAAGTSEGELFSIVSGKIASEVAQA